MEALIIITNNPNELQFIQAILSNNSKFYIRGFVSDTDFVDTKSNLENLGKINVLNDIDRCDYGMCIASPSSPFRRVVFDKYWADPYCFQFINILRSELRDTVLGFGNHIYPNVVVDHFTEIGYNNVIRTGSSFGHHCSIGSGNTFGANCMFGNNVYIGDNCTFENGVDIHDMAHIGNNVIVEAGVRIEYHEQIMSNKTVGKHTR